MCSSVLLQHAAGCRGRDGARFGRALHVCSEQQSEFLAGEFAIAKDLAHQSRPDRLTRMDGNHRRPAGRMSHEVMARTGPDDEKPALSKTATTSLPVSARSLLMMQW